MASKHMPHRTAIIGLSSLAITSWASSAHLPGLFTSTGRSKIQITALLNSSVDAAKSAIEKYKLPAETKAYGSPDDLAADPYIDLVICNTRVDKHYETIIPSVRAGKDVYVEWPVAAKQEHIDELIKAARKSGSRVAIGLQRRWAPSVLKTKDILRNENGGSIELGKVLSVDVRAFGGTIDREILPIGLKYFANKEIGGNPIVIGVGHLLDFVLWTVGDLDPTSVQSKSQIQRCQIRIRDPYSGKIIETTSSDVPDLLSFHGTLKPSTLVASDATLSFLFRRGQPFPGSPALTWTINCENGEIRLTAPSLALGATAKEDKDNHVSIQVHHFDNDRVDDIVWEWSRLQEEVPMAARNVMECLFAFAEGRKEGDGWVGLEDAAARAALIAKFLQDQ